MPTMLYKFLEISHSNQQGVMMNYQTQTTPHLAVLDPEKKPFERRILPTKNGIPQKFKAG